MKTCKDCLHYEACKGTYYMAKGEEAISYEFEGEMYAHSGCEHFKDKADCVEVVRCKDCDKLKVGKNSQYCTEHSDGFGSHIIYVGEDDFCSFGERNKENE